MSSQKPEERAMPDFIVVTDANLSDAQGIADVQKATWLATYPNEEAGISYHDIEERVNRFGRGIYNRLANPNPNSHYWVAKTPDRVVGMCLALREEEKNTLQAIYILPEFQGKHIGAKLLLEALQWLGNKKDIVLGVVTYNQNAIEFYRKYGFVENGSRQDDVAKLPSGKVLPEIEMIKRADN